MTSSEIRTSVEASAINLYVQSEVSMIYSASYVAAELLRELQHMSVHVAFQTGPSPRAVGTERILRLQADLNEKIEKWVKYNG